LLGRSLITQSVPLSGCLDQNWCKSLLEKEQEWLENCSSWPGNIKPCSSNVALYSTSSLKEAFLIQKEQPSLNQQ